jgi:hypothetical protein
VLNKEWDDVVAECPRAERGEETLAEAHQCGFYEHLQVGDGIFCLSHALKRRPMAEDYKPSAATVKARLADQKSMGGT